jgi:hypothetical protein
MLDTKVRMSWWLPCVLADKMVLEMNPSFEVTRGCIFGPNQAPKW